MAPMDMASPGRSPASPGMHQSPVAKRAHTTPSKTHTPIRLTDPRTKEPIDLHGSEKKTPASSNASVAKGSPVPASPSPVKADSPQKPPVVNGGSDASPSSPKSPAVAASSGSGSSAADKLKEQIKMKLEAERKEKERKEQEQQKEKEDEERKKKEAEAEEEEKKRVELEKQKEQEIAEEEKEPSAPTAAVEEPQEKTVSEEEIAAAVASVNDKIKQSTNSPTKTLVNAVNGPQPSIEQVQEFTYPFGVNPPAARSKTKYKYDIPFLLQFQSVVNFPPVENWDERRATIQQSSKDDRRNNSKGPKGGMKNMPMGQAAMGSFQSNAGYRGMGDRSASMGMGGFGGRGNMNRMPSAGMGGKSGRQGSSRRRGGGGDRSGSNRGGRDHSKREEEEKEKPEPAAPPPRSATAWVPKSRQQKAAAEQPVSEDNRMAPELVQRKVKSLLNKMTMENFERISDQILEIASQSKYEKDGRTLRQVIELTFAKAVDESHWSSMYAQFCMKMLTNVDPEIEDENIKDQKDNPVKGGPLFRKYLLNKCQEEFEQGWSDKLPTNEDGTPLDPELMSDEYYKAVAAKRRGLGLIRFIGELFMLGLLSEKIIHACIGKLCGTDDPSEEVIESLCQLVTTVGKKVDSNPNARRYVDAYFVKMKEFQNQPGLPSRLRFKLMDVADLRARGWDSKDANKGPMKLAQIHDEAKQKAAEDAARQANRSRGHYRGGGGGGHDHSRSNMNMAGDLSKIGRIRSQGSGQTLGPSSMLNREGSGSSRRSNTSSPGAPLSGESSRQPSQRESQQSSANSSQRANIFEHLTEDSDKPASEAAPAASSAPETTTAPATQNSNASGAEETNAD